MRADRYTRKYNILSNRETLYIAADMSGGNVTSLSYHENLLTALICKIRRNSRRMRTSNACKQCTFKFIIITTNINLTIIYDSSII